MARHHSFFLCWLLWNLQLCKILFVSAQGNFKDALPNRIKDRTDVLINRAHFSFLKVSNILRRVNEDLQKRRHRALMTSSSNKTSDEIREAMARVEHLELYAKRLEEHLDALGVSLSRSNVSKGARAIAAERKNLPNYTDSGVSPILTLQQPSKNKQRTI